MSLIDLGGVNLQRRGLHGVSVDLRMKVDRKCEKKKGEAVPLPGKALR